MNLFAMIGEKVLVFLAHIGGIAILFFSTIYWIFQPSRLRKNIFAQMVFVGMDSLLIIGVTSLLVGMVTAWQTGMAVESLGGKTYIGGIVAVALVREMSPLIVGLMCAGRVGSSFAAEIGSMKITEQIDALQALAVEPIQHLVVPRFLACMIMTPVLVIFANLIGLFGGWLVATNNLGVESGIYINHVIHFTKVKDIYFGLTKATVYGMATAIISCYRGFAVSGGTEDVSRATTFAVVFSSLAILLADYFFSVLFNLL